MERIILLGPPGSGKGTQAELLEKNRNFICLSTGDLLREEIKKESEFGKNVKHYLDNGLLVPDEIITEFILETIEKNRFFEKKVVFDGFPRRVSQADALNKKLAEFSSSIDSTILIKLDKEEIIKRLTGRLVCPECKKVYPASHSEICDNCGAKLVKRTDDNEEVIKKRINVYNEETAPLIEYFNKLGKLIEIDGNGSIEEVHNKIVEVINKQ